MVAKDVVWEKQCPLYFYLVLWKAFKSPYTTGSINTKEAEKSHPGWCMHHWLAVSAELLPTGHSSAPLLTTEAGKERNCIFNQGCFCFCRVSINSGCSGHHDPIYYFLLCVISGFHSPTLPSKARRKICANLYYPAAVMWVIFQHFWP